MSLSLKASTQPERVGFASGNSHFSMSLKQVAFLKHIPYPPTDRLHKLKRVQSQIESTWNLEIKTSALFASKHIGHHDFFTTATGKQGCCENSKETRRLSPGPAWCTICRATRFRRVTCSICFTSKAHCERLTAESSGALVTDATSSCKCC